MYTCELTLEGSVDKSVRVLSIQSQSPVILSHFNAWPLQLHLEYKLIDNIIMIPTNEWPDILYTDERHISSIMAIFEISW